MLALNPVAKVQMDVRLVDCTLALVLQQALAVGAGSVRLGQGQVPLVNLPGVGGAAVFPLDAVAAEGGDREAESHVAAG